MHRDADAMMSTPTSFARRAWTLFEPIHAIVYFAPEAPEHYAAAGLRGGWMGYFASRSAPMGPVTEDVVTAVFYGFRPAMVARAIPDAWQYSSPGLALAARTAVADGALRRLWGSDVDSGEVAATAAATTAIARGLNGDGRPLFAATAALDVPSAPHLALWHACTLLREHRFEGHTAALTVNGLDGLDSLITAVASGAWIDAPTLRRFRGWTDEEWADGEQRLRVRGVLDHANRLTVAGRALRESVEATTDQLANDAWAAMDDGAREALLASLRRLAVRLEGPGGLSYPNPIGVGRPS